VLADAQQEKVYVQRFDRHTPAGETAAASELMIVPFADWLAKLEPDAWMSGPGLRVFQQRLPQHRRAVDAAFWDPRPESLLHLGLDRYRRGERDDIWSLEPLYLRPSSAEEKWRSQGR
jgi:tRNA A37 threonylcarbamoyladenosine modification protein TsaB